MLSALRPPISCCHLHALLQSLSISPCPFSTFGKSSMVGTMNLKALISHFSNDGYFSNLSPILCHFFSWNILKHIPSVLVFSSTITSYQHLSYLKQLKYIILQVLVGPGPLTALGKNLSPGLFQLLQGLPRFGLWAPLFITFMFRLGPLNNPA
jgi:hypothetical protein